MTADARHLLAINWMITYRCERACRYCLTASGQGREMGELDTKGRLRALEALSSLGVKRISIMGGEPFLVEDLGRLITFSRAHGMTLNLTTAGQRNVRGVLAECPEGIQYLNVSLDGTADVHDALRGRGSFDAAQDALAAALAEGVRLRIYPVLTPRSAEKGNLRFLFQEAQRCRALCLMFIFLAPTGRGASCADQRIPPEQRPPILEHIRTLSREYGVRFKHCDPYEPEGFKVFMDVDGSLYKHAGRGLREPLGHIHEEPDGAFWSRMSETERQRHWDDFLDLYEQGIPDASAATLAPPEMRYVPPGIFTMGGGAEERQSPARPVYTDGFFIDARATTNREYATFLNETAPAPAEVMEFLNLESRCCLIEFRDDRYHARPGFSEYPVVEVSWRGAAAYAAWRGKRLPTEAEWEKAARGGVPDRLYPWGNEPPDAQCNWRGYAGEHAGRRPDFHHGRGPVPVGLFPPNPLGLHDMAGNVWEWCEDWYDRGTGAAGEPRSNPCGPRHGSRKVLRGGSWSFAPDNLRVAHRSYADPRTGYPYDGFRCVISTIELFMKGGGSLRAEPLPAATDAVPGHAASVTPLPPRSSSLRAFREDERCRFRPLRCEGVRVVARLTYRCNMECPHCLAAQEGPERELDTEAWQRILRELPQINARKLLLTGGEPTLRPDLVQLIEAATAAGVPTDLNTNLQNVTRLDMRDYRRAGLTEISVSIEGTERIHDAIHGKAGAFHAVMNGIRMAHDFGIDVDVACCLTAHNRHVPHDVLRLVESLPVASLTFSRMLPIGHGRGRRESRLGDQEYEALHDELKRTVVAQASIPVRLVGFLHPPEEADCPAGGRLVGLMPDGALVPCVLMPALSYDLPHPLQVGLVAALARLQALRAGARVPLCWGEP